MEWLMTVTVMLELPDVDPMHPSASFAETE